MSALDLFEGDRGQPERQRLEEGAWLLRGFAREAAPQILHEIERISSAAPFRNMQTPGGGRMSAAMTGSGIGWVTDRSGYRYAEVDPESGRPWEPIPTSFLELAASAAAEAGFPAFTPDACLINRYEPGARMGLHQDRDEADFSQPIVSISLGLPAVFLWGGLRRSDPTRRIRLEHGDVVVWGGAARLVFHGISPLAEGEHPLTGRYRYNLTFRRAR
jgi:alkylated DNA repair protein (DNA oxidative demethylase)